MNGICGCWYDSIPALFISGQVNISESLHTIKSRPRQRGFQEMPVVESLGHFTVFSKRIENNTISHITDVFTSAIQKIKCGRFGPAIIDLPVNIQMSSLYNISEVIKTISESKQLLVLYGMGIRHSKSEHLVKKLGLPFVTSWAAKDLLYWCVRFKSCKLCHTKLRLSYYFRISIRYSSDWWMFTKVCNKI